MSQPEIIGIVAHPEALKALERGEATQAMAIDFSCTTVNDTPRVSVSFDVHALAWFLLTLREPTPTRTDMALDVFTRGLKHLQLIPDDFAF